MLATTALLYPNGGRSTAGTGATTFTPQITGDGGPFTAGVWDDSTPWDDTTTWTD